MARATLEVRSRWRGMWAFQVAARIAYVPMTARMYERLVRWLMGFVALETSANGGPWVRQALSIDVKVD